jgi:hypothetical protein
MISQGARVDQHCNSIESARKIVRQVLSQEVVTLRLQKELVDEKKPLEKTQAGEAIHRELEDLHKELLREQQELIEQMKKEQDEKTRKLLADHERQLLERDKKAKEERDKLNADREAEMRKIKAERDAELKKVESNRKAEMDTLIASLEKNKPNTQLAQPNLSDFSKYCESRSTPPVNFLGLAPLGQAVSTFFIICQCTPFQKVSRHLYTYKPNAISHHRSVMLPL